MKSIKTPDAKSLKDNMSKYQILFEPARKKIVDLLSDDKTNINKVKAALVDADKLLTKAKNNIAKAKPYCRGE